jgi:hypothetical protein
VHVDDRRAEALLARAQDLRAALGLRAVPDHAPRWWCSRHKVNPRLLARGLTETVPLFQRTAAPRSRTVADHGARGDHGEGRPLVAHPLARLPLTHRLADDGDDAAANRRWWREDRGRESMIPPVAGRPARGLTRQRYRRQRPFTCPRPADGQRWNVETRLSVVKRRRGGDVTPRRDWPQVDHGVLQPVGQLAVAQHLAEEIPTEGQHDGQRPRRRRLQEFVHEAAASDLLAAEGVEFFPLVRHTAERWLPGEASMRAGGSEHEGTEPGVAIFGRIERPLLWPESKLITHHRCGVACV